MPFFGTFRAPCEQSKNSSKKLCKKTSQGVCCQVLEVAHKGEVAIVMKITSKAPQGVDGAAVKDGQDGASRVVFAVRCS